MHPAVSSILSYPEGRAALAAARRGARLTADAHGRVVQELESMQDELSLIGIDAQLARQAGELAETHALRGYHAVHLASALSISDEVTVISWDRNPRDAAESGCATAPATLA